MSAGGGGGGGGGATPSCGLGEYVLLNMVWFSGSLFCILNRESFWTASLKKKEGWRQRPT